MNEDERRAEKAERLLKDQMFADSFNEVRQDIFESIAASGIADETLRHEAYLSLRVLTSVKLKLESHIRRGKVSEAKSQEVVDIPRIQELP